MVAGVCDDDHDHDDDDDDEDDDDDGDSGGLGVAELVCGCVRGEVEWVGVSCCWVWVLECRS